MDVGVLTFEEFESRIAAASSADLASASQEQCQDVSPGPGSPGGSTDTEASAVSAGTPGHFYREQGEGKRLVRAPEESTGGASSEGGVSSSSSPSTGTAAGLSAGRGYFYPPALIERLKSKRLLQWVVTHPEDISRANFLMGAHKQSFEQLQEYDLVELRAVYAVLPEVYLAR